MYFKKFLLIGFLILSLSGCGFFSSKSKVANDWVFDRPTGRLVNSKAFISGGALAVLPFKAGEGTVADPQFDRMSLMISKGIIDYFKEQKVPFKLLSTQDEGSPQMLVEGYIERLRKSGLISKVLLKPQSTSIEVSGQVLVVASKERILIFKHSKMMTKFHKDEFDLAYQTGQDLGRFIVDALVTE